LCGSLEVDGLAFCEGANLINKDNPDLLDDYRKSILDTSTYLIRRITTIETFDADPNGVITSLRSPSMFGR